MMSRANYCLLGIVALIGCSNEKQSQNPTQQNQSTQQSANANNASSAKGTSKSTATSAISDSTAKPDSQIQKRLKALEAYVSCLKLRERTERAWRQHRPSAGKCRGGGRGCANTRLPPNTFRNYRYRISKVSNALRADATALKKALEKIGDAPVSPREKYSYSKGQDKAEYLRLRQVAEDLTSQFSKRCFGVLSD